LRYIIINAMAAAGPVPAVFTTGPSNTTCGTQYHVHRRSAAS
jgi:hypothetical protein